MLTVKLVGSSQFSRKDLQVHHCKRYLPALIIAVLVLCVPVGIAAASSHNETSSPTDSGQLTPAFSDDLPVGVATMGPGR